MKRLVKYRLVYSFGGKDSGYIDKSSLDWCYDYLESDELTEMINNCDVTYITFDSLRKDVHELPYTTLRKSILGHEYIHIQFPLDIEPYIIKDDKCKYLPIKTRLEVEDVKESITWVAEHLNIHTFLEFLKDQGVKGDQVNECTT